ncbi:hypothetical protein PORCRE_1278 [Porphyromonas crevioricanis JCM 15906]|uniref:Uncharacterized protein n=1 Tax=Porphyromonas crevioricanis JCM 15906 TaxID=1305617 RepID=T1CR66_9PORP|nr:hypothetical protein PORCRE_1278 [Porphyromonas crevioricanis JCM 15906]
MPICHISLFVFHTHPSASVEKLVLVLFPVGAEPCKGTILDPLSKKKGNLRA